MNTAISTPVPILQHEAEFEQLIDLYRAERPPRTLEVGTYHGGTLYHWLQNAKEGALVVSVDSYTTGVDNRHLYGEWAPPGVSLAVVNGDSRSFQVREQTVVHAPYDFIFIDAGHYYDEVKADWETFMPMGQRGGIVALHDILTHPAHPEIEVGRLWEEIQGMGLETWEIVSDREALWGGIGVVRLP